MKTKLKKLYLQLLSTVDQGKQLEIIASDEKGNEIENMPYPLATFVADENDDSLFFEIYPEKGGIIQIPISELKSAIEVAEREVHSENWYKKNVYKEED